jgi:hypothetical protein
MPIEIKTLKVPGATLTYTLRGAGPLLFLIASKKVRKLVAHEPPVEGVLPEFDHLQAEVADGLHQGGVQAALANFFPRLGLRYDVVEPGVVLAPPNPQAAAARGQSLMRYTFPAVHRYRLNVEKLAATPVPVILAGSEAGQDGAPYRWVQALAARLEKELFLFPSPCWLY